MASSPPRPPPAQLFQVGDFCCLSPSLPRHSSHRDLGLKCLQTVERLVSQYARPRGRLVESSDARKSPTETYREALPSPPPLSASPSVRRVTCFRDTHANCGHPHAPSDTGISKPHWIEWCKQCKCERKNFTHLFIYAPHLWKNGQAQRHH